MFTFGEVSDVLKVCAHVYAKEENSTESKILELSESLKRKLIDFEGTMRSCDVQCVAFSYRPIFEDEITRVQDIKDSHVFLGLISVCPEPKEHFQEFVDDLEAAGVRFTYFSPYREQPSKAFGERLGLETDWNSCILLSDHPNPSSQSTGYSALSDIKARLPRGIKAIRPHLEDVDDIPLHVSIFAECNDQNSSEMIKIYQEAGEVVSVIGSCRSVRNSKCFGTAHFGIGSDPFLCVNNTDKNNNNNNNFDHVALSINAASFKLILPTDSSPYIITELIRESRTILQNSINAWEFVIGSITCLLVSSIFTFFFIDFKSNFDSLPSSLTSILILIFSIFAIGFTISIGPYDPAVMKTHPTGMNFSKCPEKEISLSFTLSSASMTILRFLPSIFIFCLTNFIFKKSFSYANILDFYLIILIAQALPFQHCHQALQIKTIHQTHPNLVISIIMCSSLGIIRVFYNRNSSIPGLFVIIIITLTMSVICVTWHETIKSVYLRDYYDQAQKRAKLLFNTKLGMHSPI